MKYCGNYLNWLHFQNSIKNSFRGNYVCEEIRHSFISNTYQSHLFSRSPVFRDGSGHVCQQITKVWFRFFFFFITTSFARTVLTWIRSRLDYWMSKEVVRAIQQPIPKAPFRNIRFIFWAMNCLHGLVFLVIKFVKYISIDK